MVDPIGELLKISPKPPIDREPRPNTYSVADLAASLEQDQERRVLSSRRLRT